MAENFSYNTPFFSVHIGLFILFPMQSIFDLNRGGVGGGVGVVDIKSRRIFGI